MTKIPVGTRTEVRGDSDSARPASPFPYFILSVLGFSSWFFLAVPFASHRESYWWLGMVRNYGFAKAFGFISSTYRPLAQGVTWLGFMLLDPRIFPTSVLRQALFQGFIYAMFVLAWWLIFPAAAQRRLFAMLAFVTGLVFFSGYVHLFHIYGMFYVPVMLMLGSLLRFYVSSAVDRREVWFAVVATLLVFWHPFATGLFLGFFFGFYLETFWHRSAAQHVQAIGILLAGTTAIGAMVVLFPRAAMPLNSRLFGFLVSYQTNEVNRVASLVAFILTVLVVLSMRLPLRVKVAALMFFSALAVVCFWKSIPLLLLWLCSVLIKLLGSRRWSLFFLVLAATLLPFGGGIGSPMYALFAIILATYVTALGWSQAEQALRSFDTRYVAGMVVASAVVIVLLRVGINVPIFTQAATPLLRERERTYQLENTLAWLHRSGYCSDQIAFAENAGNPASSVENVITRRNRPPSALEDVQLFWNNVLQCQGQSRSHGESGTALITFDQAVVAGSSPVYVVKGRYAGDAIVWIENSQRR